MPAHPCIFPKYAGSQLYLLFALNKLPPRRCFIYFFPERERKKKKSTPMCRLRLKKRSRGEKDWGVKGWIGLKEKEEQAETHLWTLFLYLPLEWDWIIPCIFHKSIYLAALSHSPFLALTNGGPFFVFPCSLWLDDHTVIRAPLWSGKHVCQLMILSNQALLVQPLTKNIFKVALKSVPVSRVMWTTALCGRNWVAWALWVWSSLARLKSEQLLASQFSI